MSASEAIAAIIGYRCHVAEGPEAAIGRAATISSRSRQTKAEFEEKL
jgi:hypothetical protein